MLDKTLGYILCCQSPALFLAALALLVAYLAGRKHRVKAFFRLLLCILCAAARRGAVLPGYLYGILTIRDFVIRAAGWIGLAIAAFVLLALALGVLRRRRCPPRPEGGQPRRERAAGAGGGGAAAPPRSRLRPSGIPAAAAPVPELRRSPCA